MFNKFYKINVYIYIFLRQTQYIQSFKLFFTNLHRDTRVFGFLEHQISDYLRLLKFLRIFG